MKKVLVPTDFSQNSMKTLEYVVESLKNIPVEVVLIWVNSIRSKDVLVSESDPASTETAAIFRLEQLISDYSPRLKEGTMSYRVREGKVHIEVAKQAKDEDVDLVVCGTHGASGFEEFYVGSNAYRIVMYCKSPVLTVRPSFHSQIRAGIYVMPIDCSADTRQKVSITCKIAKITGAQIHILGMYTSKSESIKHKVDSYVAQVEKYITEEGIRHKTIFMEAGNSISKTIVSYADSVNANLISIMTEQGSSAFSFLLGTYAEQTIGMSRVPVLSTTPKMLATASFA